MIDKQELRRLAEAFPGGLDWDSNTEPFFNGPSGESLGGGADGTYAVYGKPFRLEGEDYDYDGPTYVERCGKDFAKFIVEARGAVLALLDELDKVDADRKACWAEFKALCRSADEKERYLREELEQCRKDAERYRWLREQEAEQGLAVLHVSGWERAATCWATTYPDAELLDAAIDVAMAKDGGANG